MYLFKRFRSFIAENLKSVGQRAAKLLAVKFGGLKKKSALKQTEGSSPFALNKTVNKDELRKAKKNQVQPTQIKNFSNFYVLRSFRHAKLTLLCSSSRLVPSARVARR